MVATFITCILLSCFCFSSYAYNQVGIIIKKGDEGLATIVEQVLNDQQNADSGPKLDIRILTETIEKEDSVNYHRAFCRLAAQGIIALVSPASEPHNSILVGYSYDYQIPFITTELPEITSGLSSPYAIGIRPSPTRAILGLIQYYDWKDIVYIYDHEYGPEKLQLIFLLGHRVLNLSLDGMLKVDSAEWANWYLQKLDRSYGNKRFHVILDTDPNLAREIIWRHVNDVNVRKKNFHFLLSQPTLDHFWTSDGRAFGSVNVTTFIMNYPDVSKMAMQNWMKPINQDFNLLSLYYYDAGLVLYQIIKKLFTNDYRLQSNFTRERDCLDDVPTPIINSDSLSRILQEIKKNGATGGIHFEDGQRTNFDLNIKQITSRGTYLIGTWSQRSLHLNSLSERDVPTSLPLIQDSSLLRIVTVISPPYMMFKTDDGNGTSLIGNDRFEGYLKDVIDLLSEEMGIEYELNLAEDSEYGKYAKTEGRWTGVMGEIIHGKADLAAADITITGQRQRVVDFTDPYDMIGFSLAMKNPLSIPTTSSMFFFVTAFSADVWVCIIITILIFGALFHLITMFTGAPDSIESASGIWGRKHTVIVNAWFAAGSSMFQGTGVYPRSISSRVLSGVFWLFTFILSALFIASITVQVLNYRQLSYNNPQLSQLKDLSLESIISESVSRGWPKVGLVYPSNTAAFMKQSKLPTFMKYAEYLEKNPDVMVGTMEEGLKRVQESAGNYMLLLESLSTEYIIRRKPCDIVATHDSVHYAGYGFATSLGSHWTSDVNAALSIIQNKGALGSLHRKWWIDSSECKTPIEERNNERTIHVFTGLLAVTAVGFFIILAVFGIQYIRKNQNKESRRQQLSFEDMNLGQTFPAPPPELLAEPAPVLNLPEYDRKTLL